MFTSNQIEEIRKKLQLGGVKDTSFPPAGPLKGNETMAIVQQGQNRQLGLKTLIEKVGIYTISDFINLSKSSEDSYTLEEVIKLVEPINRKAGQVITFMDSSTGDWAIYQFKGKTASEWFNLELWDNILAKVDNHFKGWFLNICLLKEYYPRPHVGDFAFVGNSLEEAVVYACIKYGEWYNTKCPALVFADKFEAVYSKDFGEFEYRMDETYADRATKDALGRIIHDTYVTTEGLPNFVIEKVYEEVIKQITNIQIQDGSITWDKLAEGVKQMFQSGGNVTNLPDDEDLTVNEDNQLKFADKAYNENNFTGYGRKFLRKNMIAGINILGQYMVNEAHTRYVIQYDYCLNEKTIEIPEDCILDMMQGGNLMNGTIHCNNTLIMAPDPENICAKLTGTYQFFGGSGTATNIIDSLDSHSTEDALSANMGRVLNERIQSFMKAMKVTQEEYNALNPKDPDVFYLIVG